MTQHDPVVASLEQLAEHAGDVSQDLLRRFALRCPDAAALMSHMDACMIGRMTQDVLMLLMTPPEDIDRHYLAFEVGSHRAYGVTADMFPPLLEVVRATVEAHLEDQWTPELARAWAKRLTAVGASIDRVARAAG